MSRNFVQYFLYALQRSQYNFFGRIFGNSLPCPDNLRSNCGAVGAAFLYEVSWEEAWEAGLSTGLEPRWLADSFKCLRTRTSLPQCLHPTDSEPQNLSRPHVDNICPLLTKKSVGSPSSF